MSKSAHWEGDISARQAVLAGQVIGKIVIEDKLEISASAVITGEIVAKILAIANGARIEGEVTVTSGKADPEVRREAHQRRRRMTSATPSLTGSVAARQAVDPVGEQLHARRVDGVARQRRHRVGAGAVDARHHHRARRGARRDEARDW